MTKTEQKFLTLIGDHNLIHEGDKILIGLSGGPDSVFLLYLMVKYQRKFKIEIGTAHINHSLRELESDADDTFCKELSKKLNVKYFNIKLDIKKIALAKKKSVEETAREERYKFFESIADSKGYNKIATAHNLNDNSETVLLNIIKGAGLRGISGIPVQRDNIIRPILNISKTEILNALEQNNIPYRVDLSNESNLYERNIIRHELLPLIRNSINPSVDKSIFNSSLVFRNELQIIDYFINSVSRNIIRFSRSILSISLKELNKINIVILGELLRKSIMQYFHQEIEYDDYRKVKNLMNKQTGKRIFLSGKLFGYKDREYIYIQRIGKKEKEEEQTIVKVDEPCYFNNNEIRIFRSEKKNTFISSNYHEIISGDHLDDIFLLRQWKNGDKFIPLGMKNFKKVSDFLTEQKVPTNKRKEQLVLINSNEIVWLPGLRIDERVKISNTTKRIYELWMMQRS